MLDGEREEAIKQILLSPFFSLFLPHTPSALTSVVHATAVDHGKDRR